MYLLTIYFENSIILPKISSIIITNFGLSGDVINVRHFRKSVYGIWKQNSLDFNNLKLRTRKQFLLPCYISLVNEI